MTDEHLTNSIEWFLNNGKMASDMPISDALLAIEETTIDWDVKHNPKPERVADLIRVATKCKISGEPHSFTVTWSQLQANNRIGVTSLCWYEEC